MAEERRANPAGLGPVLSPAAVELLGRLDDLTARLERAVQTLENNVGADPVQEEERL